MKNILFIAIGGVLLAACASTDNSAQSQQERLAKIRQDCINYYQGQDRTTDSKIANCITARKANL